MNSAVATLFSDVKIICNDLSKADPLLVEMFCDFQIDHLDFDELTDESCPDLMCYEEPLDE
jgi:hypothetical protein